MKKNKIGDSDIRHLARLANLKLTEEEIVSYSKQLSAIVEYVDLLSEVDTDQVESAASASGLTNKFRKDEEGGKASLKLTNLEVVDKSGKLYFKVKRIM